MQDTEAATLTPREKLTKACALVTRMADACECGSGCRYCHAQYDLVDAYKQMTTWIRENRGRLHRPTCMDGNGCRCGLGELPMWGAAG